MRRQALYTIYDVYRNVLEITSLGMRHPLVETRISHFRDFLNV